MSDNSNITLNEEDILINNRGSIDNNGNESDEWEIKITVPNDFRNWTKTEADNFKQQILENQKIVDRLRNDYKLYKDGFSTLEGWVMDDPQLRKAVDEFLELILMENNNEQMS